MKRFMIFGLELALFIGLAGCGGGTGGGPVDEQDPPCEHPYTEWVQGEETHYQICPNCGQKHDEDPHRFVNVYGDTCIVRSNRDPMVRVTVPADIGEGVALKEVWVFVESERDTLRLAWATNTNGAFTNGKDLSVVDGGWLKYDIEERFSNVSLYSCFRLEAKSADITVREIVFLGQKESGGDLILLDAAPITDESGYKPSGLTDCQQFPGERFACQVCGKPRE